ncbi:MAG: hypothetical protein ABIE23_01580 [archaeon]
MKKVWPVWVLALWLLLNAPKAAKNDRLGPELPPQPKSLIESLSANPHLYPEFEKLDSLASQPYKLKIGNEIMERKLPKWMKPLLPNLLMLESSLDSAAVSYKGAKGLGQLTQDALKELERVGYKINPFNRIENMKGTVILLIDYDWYLEKFSSYYPKYLPEKKREWLLAAFFRGQKRVLKHGIPSDAKWYIKSIINRDTLKFYEEIKEKRKKLSKKPKHDLKKSGKTSLSPGYAPKPKVRRIRV